MLMSRALFSVRVTVIASEAKQSRTKSWRMLAWIATAAKAASR